jgi:hypothetical protein
MSQPPKIRSGYEEVFTELSGKANQYTESVANVREKGGFQKQLAPANVIGKL